jgi:hypothetical protein
MQSRRPYLAYNSQYDPQKELDSLYERRSAIDALIQSLEEYDRQNMKCVETPERKSA